MRYLFFLLVFIFSLKPCSAQHSSLSGKVTISMQQRSINSDFILTNVRSENQEVVFMINDQVKVKEATINGLKLAVKKIKEKCNDCTIYRLISENGFKETDEIKLLTTGKFKNYTKGDHKSDYKGKMVSNYGILRASEQAKWYPVLIDNTIDQPSFLRKYAYQYDISATCDDCKHVYVGGGTPGKSGKRFASSIPSNDIMLIAGDYNWVEKDNAVFINIKDPTLIKHIDDLFLDISTYYQKLVGFEMPSKFVFAHLPSDNTSWGGFMTYPTIVKVTKRITNKNLEPYLSHEIGHYLFGDVFKPSTKLYWFYLESFAEYISYKYMLATDPQLLQRDYNALGRNMNFVRLDKVTSHHQINGQHRYNTAPFQLLAIDRKIGEAKMVAFIKEVYSQLGESTDGYATFINSLKKVGVSNDIIKSIEEDIIQQFDIREYQFVEKLINSGK